MLKCSFTFRVVSLRKGRPPVTEEQARELFTVPQRRTWPGAYRPTTGVAALLHKDGIPLQQLVDLRKEIADDHNAELQKDLAYDMNLWTRCSFEQEVLTADEQRRRLIRRVLQRDRIPTYSEVAKFAKVPSLADRNNFDEECRDLPGVQRTAKELHRRMNERRKKEDSCYPFTSQAWLQHHKVFSAIEGCQAMSQPVKIPDFPTLSNLLHHHYDSCSFIKYVASRTGDELLLSQEFVRELALYLRRRVEEIRKEEARKKKSSRNNSNNYKKEEEQGACVLFMFSNGRLLHALKEAAIPIGLPLVAVNTKKRLIRKDATLPVLGEKETPSSWCHDFSSEVEIEPSVVKSLAKHRPLIVVGEPHCDRDWTAEMRGFHTVREVLLLGQVDSAAMCSFSYPWLSFGCAPSMETYFAYNSLFQRLNIAPDSQFMPMDAPYVQQGYEKLYVDTLSKWMVCANDTKDAPHQSRACVFRRKTT